MNSITVTQFDYTQCDISKTFLLVQFYEKAILIDLGFLGLDFISKCSKNI